MAALCLPANDTANDSRATTLTNRNKENEFLLQTASQRHILTNSCGAAKSRNQKNGSGRKDAPSWRVARLAAADVAGSAADSLAAQAGVLAQFMAGQRSDSHRSGLKSTLTAPRQRFRPSDGDSEAAAPRRRPRLHQRSEDFI